MIGPGKVDGRVAHASLRFLPPLFAAPQRAAEHYHSIDLLRGLAALAVLFWHYQGFFSTHPGETIPAQVIVGQPLYPWFKWLYMKGYYAVELFWTISGFVFTAVYVNSDSTTKEFAIARFARLYPLHAITLVVVCMLEFVSIAVTGDTKCFSNFDLHHFMLNLFFASAWGFERGFSFNGPVWSVSVEIPIYALFWVLHRFLFNRGIAGPAAVMLAMLTGTLMHLPGHIWECGFFFFAGACIYVAHRSLRLNAQLGMTCAAYAAGAYLAASHFSLAIVILIFGSVLFTAAMEPHLGSVARTFDWIGDNTYSIYLWQIPVQICLMLLIVDKAVYFSPFFMAAYLVGLTLLARVSYLYIERPFRRILRTRFAAVPA